MSTWTSAKYHAWYLAYSVDQFRNLQSSLYTFYAEQGANIALKVSDWTGYYILPQTSDGDYDTASVPDPTSKS